MPCKLDSYVLNSVFIINRHGYDDKSYSMIYIMLLSFPFLVHPVPQSSKLCIV